MTAALIKKELRQHWPAFSLLAGLLGIGFLLVTRVVVITEEGSILEALRRFLLTFVVIALLVLCNRLVVREYQSKTQLFLEALPLTRLRMVIVKFLLGLALIVAVVTVAFAVLLVTATRGESLTSRFVQILAARTYSFVLCAYAFFFVMGLLGRYRVAIYLATVFGFLILNGATDLEVDRFGPFALLDDQFAYERHQFPATALLMTIGLAGILIAMTLVLSLIREGSVATLLAQKMSHREKVFISLLVLGLLCGFSAYDTKTEKEPFDLPGAIVQEGAGIVVKVSVEASPDVSTGRQLAKSVWSEMAALREYLRLEDQPPVFIVLRQDLDADVYERAELKEAEGVLVRANFLSKDWNQRGFLTWLVRETLIEVSHERLKWEPRMWVLDGFALFWAQRTSATTPQLDARQLTLRAAYGSVLGFSKQELGNWLTYRERVGGDIAAAVAWSGLTLLACSQGDDICRQFLCSALRTDLPADVRALWYEWKHPWPRELEQASGVPCDVFLDRWLEHLATTRRSLADELACVPRLEGVLTFAPLSPMTREVNYRLVADPPPKSDRFRLLHSEIEAFDVEVPPNVVQWEDLSYENGRKGELPGTFARGTRLRWTFAVRSERLGCEVISGWRRQEIR